MRIGEIKPLKKILILLFLAFILSGCATYKFQKSTSSKDAGYVVAYDNKPILEYTVGKEKSLPDLDLAKVRFNRRRATVEYYLKKSGEIESRFKEYLWDTPTMLLDFLGGILRWPYTAVSDYKYNHDPKYKARMDRLDEENDNFQRAKVNQYKEKLAAYIVQDLDKESLAPGEVVKTSVVATPVVSALVVKEVAAPASVVVGVPSATVEAPVVTLEPVVAVAPAVAPVTEVNSVVEEIKPLVVEMPVIKKELIPPIAVITAKPEKGLSPLIVKFSGQRSTSKNGKIVAYHWDFGDGDTSTKINPENTYWSTIFGTARNFIVTLTVTDAAGATSSATSIISVTTP